MTICIGALCNGGKSVVLAADGMVTTNLPPIEFEHPGTKIEFLTEKSALLSAGQVLPGTEVLRRAKARLSSTGSGTMEDIAKAVGESYSEYRSEIIEQRWLKPRGLTLDLFYKEGKIQQIPREIALPMDRDMIKFNLGVDLIVAGIDEAGAHIYTVLNPGIPNCHNRIGYVAVGSGTIHAISTFIFNDFSVESTLNEAVYYACEAKINSESAPGVGVETSMAVIKASGMKMLDEEHVGLLRKTARKVIRPRLAQERRAIKALPFEREFGNEPS